MPAIVDPIDRTSATLRTCQARLPRHDHSSGGIAPPSSSHSGLPFLSSSCAATGPLEPLVPLESPEPRPAGRRASRDAGLAARTRGRVGVTVCGSPLRLASVALVSFVLFACRAFEAAFILVSRVMKNGRTIAAISVPPPGKHLADHVHDEPTSGGSDADRP
ncbi:hypothetical protein [Burkholderia cepacia]|uniref:hypothetical protein n=1 Tax=Burkholderia cepacia TaxID=292 RepID=UPI0015895155